MSKTREEVWLVSIDFLAPRGSVVETCSSSTAVTYGNEGNDEVSPGLPGKVYNSLFCMKGLQNTILVISSRGNTTYREKYYYFIVGSLGRRVIKMAAPYALLPFDHQSISN
jgi:hypothetical protein